MHVPFASGFLYCLFEVFQFFVSLFQEGDILVDSVFGLGARNVGVIGNNAYDILSVDFFANLSIFLSRFLMKLLIMSPAC